MKVATRVSFKRYFEEFGFDDYDSKDFDCLNDGFNFYNSIKDKYEDVQLWALKGDRLDFRVA